jgi:hypothetical protein
MTISVNRLLGRIKDGMHADSGIASAFDLSA